MCQAPRLSLGPAPIFIIITSIDHLSLARHQAKLSSAVAYSIFMRTPEVSLISPRMKSDPIDGETEAEYVQSPTKCLMAEKCRRLMGT